MSAIRDKLGRYGLQIKINGLANVAQRFFPGPALRPAAL